MPKRVYNDNHYSWIKDHFNDYSTSKDMCIAFNKTFGLNISYPKFISICKHRSIYRTRDKIKHRHIYTYEENKWLAENFNNLKRQQLAKMFNEIFSANINSDTLDYYCKKTLCLKKDEPYDCSKLNITEASAYRKALFSENVSPQGEHVIKTECGWYSKARYLYEQTHGKIPENTIVKHANGDKNDFSPENLITQKRHELYEEYISPCRNLHMIVTENGRCRKARYLYEKIHNVKLQKNDYIIQADGDKNNFEADNLIRISKRQMGLIGFSKWLNVNAELTKTAVLYSQLVYPDQTGISFNEA